MTDILHNIGRFLSYDPSAPMLFSSGTFWALFLVFMPLYGFLRRRLWQMVVFVVAFSFFFYYKSSGWFVLMLAATSLVDWWLSRLMSAPGRSLPFRRWCVALSLTLSLGILAYFKYANFFLWNINAMVGGNFQPLELVLPVGISFYTFQSVSYIIDVYKGRVSPTATWLEYAFFNRFSGPCGGGYRARRLFSAPDTREPARHTNGGLYRFVAHYSRVVKKPSSPTISRSITILSSPDSGRIFGFFGDADGYHRVYHADILRFLDIPIWPSA